MRSTDPGAGDRPAVYRADERRLLLSIAAQSIEHGLNQDRPLEPDPHDYPAALQDPRATFVTLQIDGALRGCIGVLEAIRPLVVDVARNAFAAAFEDPRFPPLTRAELPQLDVHLAILSPSEPLPVATESDLLQRIRPGIDGLILEDRGHRGTFLPSVWEQLPRPADFLEHLRRKAGLPAGYWSDTLRVARYTTESFGAPAREILGASLVG